MFYRRFSKALILIVGSIVIISSMMFLAGEAVGLYIDSMSRDLNSAERPEEAFNHLKKISEEPANSPLFDKTGGEDLMARLELSKLALYDTAVSSSLVMDATVLRRGENETKPRYEGVYLARCKENSSYGLHCRSKNHPKPEFIWMATGWMTMAKNMGTLDDLYSNRTARKTLQNYLKRAEYYDSRLNEGGYDMKPIQIAVYDGSGLYAAGDIPKKLKIDDKNVEFKEYSKLLYANITLGLGEHRVKAGSQSFEIKVVHRLPDNGVTDSGFGVATEENNFYHTAILKGPEGKVRKKLKEKNVTYIEIPSTKRPENEKPYLAGGSDYRPFTVKLVSEEVNVTLNKGVEDTGVENSFRYYFGMTDKEVRETMDILRNTKTFLKPFLPEGYSEQLL